MPSWRRRLTVLILLAALPLCVVAQQKAIPLPLARWQGDANEVAGLTGTFKCTVGYPEKQRTNLLYRADEDLPAGVYQLRLRLRPSHVSDEIAWHAGLTVTNGNQPVGQLGAREFARVHQPEWKTLRLVQTDTHPLRLKLAAFCEADAFMHVVSTTKVNSDIEAGPSDDGDRHGGDDAVGGFSPTTHQYFILDDAEIIPESRTGCVADVTCNKIRYTPGETLRGSATVQDISGKGGPGLVTIYLEHDVNLREKMKEIPLTLTAEAKKIDFEISLPTRELGYALVAVYTSPDGRDRCETAEYFNIADNFYRVAIHGGGMTWGNSSISTERKREAFSKARKNYQNCGEMFAWAEEDMVGMSPDSDWWFSGQTSYHLSKAGLKELIQLAHEQGISCVTYGKFIMSGYIGWKTAYDWPNDHKSQYYYPVGMWEMVDTGCLDRFMNKEFAPYDKGPRTPIFKPTVSWQNFLPINPDNTPRMTRIAAEAMMKSVEMFGWDAVRWDGHPRGGGQCGGEGQYDAYAARRTQTLVRYFKDIVNTKYPKFRHGYNYLFTQEKPDPSWAVEDFELDELCRNGGLIMNESIRNSNTSGKPFEWIARNIEVQGDLARERGGYLLGISCDGESDRDMLVEGMLYAAGGMRPMGKAAEHPLVNRYATRYSRYTFDEMLRRLEKPEGVLKPATETKLWWQPFVYETARENGKSQLVINLLNIPRKAVPKTETSKKIDWTMSPGTEPFGMGLNLPEGYTATGAHFIDPFSLVVTPVECNNNRVDIPAVGTWLVLVVDLQAVNNAPTLASLYGPVKTFGIPRPDAKERPVAPVTLDLEKTSVEVNKDMSYLSPQPPAITDELSVEKIDALSGDARNAALLKIRAKNPAETFLNGWWKGGTLPNDLKLKEKPQDFGDLTPERNGCLDIFYGRGAMDYRLRLGEIFAGLGRYQVHDAPLEGNFRAGGGHWLLNGIDWKQFPHYDLLVYTGIPHCAIGVENSYALPAYVKAGGAVLFTGGEYAFGKGGYNYTVLERELLPVLCVENLDVKYTETPLPLEAGKDFGDLGVQLDFTTKPSFYSYNRVALQDSPTVKVFLKSGNRPILVGWTLGKGRVACLLLDHRGKSDAQGMVYFDWPEWPKLMRAVIGWLTPSANAVEAKAADHVDYAALVKTLEAETANDVSVETVKAGDPDDPEGGEAGDGDPGVALDAKTLKKRIIELRQLLPGEGKDITLAFAGQLAKINNLPTDLRRDLLEAVRRNPSPTIADAARRALACHNDILRENGMQLLAISGDAGFVELANNPPHGGTFAAITHARALACAAACYPRANLLDLARGKVNAWNKTDLANKMEYTKGKEFSLAAPEQPCLEAETLYQRIGWLAYLARQDTAAFGPQFAREWLLIGQYCDYADTCRDGLWADKIMTQQQKMKKAEVFNEYIDAIRWLSRVTAPTVEWLLKEHPEQLAAGFAHAHFLHEVDRAVNLLSRYPAHDTKSILTVLATAQQPQLNTFATARLKTAQ